MKSMKTILITGCSSGFGLDTARLFLARDWNVVATMRTPRPGLFPESERIRVLALDVTDHASVRRVAESVGPIDALVNNAGIGLLSVLEGTPIEDVRAIMETNLIGAIAMTQAFLPGLRKSRGVLVNVSSSVTLAPFPLLSVYSASKAALNQFTEALAPELEPFGVRARLVLPGQAPDTAFGANAQTRMTQQGVTVPDAYADFAKPIFDRLFRASAESGERTRSADVTQAVWRAVTDPSCAFRQAAGADAEKLATAN